LITFAGAARWTAILIAAAAVVDPAVPLPVRARPVVRVTGTSPESVARQLRDAGFPLDEPEGEVAEVVVGDHPALSTEHSALSTQHLPVWVLDTTPPAPNVSMVDATGPAVRLPGQAAQVRVTLDSRGLAGKTSEVVLEDAGIVVASSHHEWKTDGERWRGSLTYLPSGVAGGRLRVHAVELPGETSTGDNAADVVVPPMRGPIRMLVETAATWPGMFARRAVEGEPAFAVSAVQRASTRIATRAGGPPSVLTRETLAPFEVALVAAPGSLTATDIAALRWFVEERGGVAVFVPDERPGGRYIELLGALALEPRTEEAPVRIGEGLMASELLIARRLPPGATTLAETDAGEPVVFSARRGAGAVIFSGALDAWRYRAASAPPSSPDRATAPRQTFAEFWRRAIAEEATAVPPMLEVSAEPSLIATGASTRVRARLRATELAAGDGAIEVEAVSARAVSPASHVDVPVRLWPTAEPGVYEGDWRPSVPGDYNVAVSAGSRRGDVAVTVAAGISHGSAADPEGLALAARTSGGRVFPANQSAALVTEMKQAFPARTDTKVVNPMRSPWWAVLFAGLLCAEWAVRRRRGLP
jgi:hypothetical protein